MTTMLEARPSVDGTNAWARFVGPAFVLGGIAFLVGGVTHPGDSGQGNKVQQLHEMLVDPSWYPSHAALLAATVLFAVGVHAVRQRGRATPATARLLTLVFWIACVATVSMAVHLFAALGADSLADGKDSLVSRAQTLNETVVDSAWGLAFAGLAVAGGLTRTVGNRITLAFGLVGGVAYALASATIPFTDSFDSLFKVGSLLAVWAILVGGLAIRDRA